MDLWQILSDLLLSVVFLSLDYKILITTVDLIELQVILKCFLVCRDDASTIIK